MCRNIRTLASVEPRANAEQAQKARERARLRFG